ncbi:sulfite exporter TauE/SafE family protein [Methylopila henanensis]|uniref:Probable membrane transporter protein n=1 Tax=Methylopila henanensis TaxID=873516 RepID=A0ABW4K1Q4_9HYPH
MDVFSALPLRELVELGLGLVAAGLVTGVLAGLFGVGGGAVIVPVLAELFDHIGVRDDVQMQLAVGTSLAIIIPTSIRSFLSHRARGSVDEAALRAWIAPVIAGALLGVGIAAYVTSDALKVVFAVFAAGMSANLLFGRESWRVASELPSRAVTGLWGFLFAVLSALIGIGGGTLGTLFLSLYGRPIHKAIGTSSALGTLIAAPAALGYAIAGVPHLADLPPLSLGYVSLIGVAVLAPVSVLSAPLGVRIAHGLSKRRLTIAFGLFLALISLRFAYDLAT